MPTMGLQMHSDQGSPASVPWKDVLTDVCGCSEWDFGGFPWWLASSQVGLACITTPHDTALVLCTPPFLEIMYCEWSYPAMSHTTVICMHSTVSTVLQSHVKGHTCCCINGMHAEVPPCGCKKTNGLPASYGLHATLMPSILEA